MPIYILFVLIPRLLGFTSPALWYDESFTLHQSHLPVDQLLGVALLDFTPPLWELLLHWTPINPLWMIRLPSLIFGLLGLLAAWQLIGALGFSRQMQGVGISVMAILPGLIWAAQDARGYAFFIFLYVTGALFAIRGKWWVLGIVNLLLLYTHATAPVYVLALMIFAFRFHPRAWKMILLTGALPVLLYLPWLLVLFDRTHDFWQTPLTGPQLLHSLIMAAFAYAFPNLWVALGASLFLVLTFIILLFKRSGWTVGLLVVIPFIGMVFVSLSVANVLLYRTLMPLLIPFVIWCLYLFDGMLESAKAWDYRYSLAGTWICIIFVSLLYFNPAERGGGLDQAAKLIEAQWQAGDVLYLGAGSGLPFADYLPGKPVYILDEVQHAGLLNQKVGAIFGMQYAALETLQPARAWLIYPQDGLMSAAARARLDGYIAGARLVGLVHYWQAADIRIYLVDFPASRASQEGLTGH